MNEEKISPSTSKPKEQDDSSSENGDAQHEYESDSSSDGENSDKCPICLLKFSNDQEIGRPTVCEHSFCFPCIEEWSKVVRTCPIDRKEFSKIGVYDNLENNNFLKTINVGQQVTINEYITAGEYETTPCEVCASDEREDVMLLCDGCDKGFHMYCLDPPLEIVPIENWYCQQCEAENVSEESSDEEIEEEADVDELNDLQNEIQREVGNLPITRLRIREPQPQIVRTQQSERIRNAILARRSLRGVFHEIPASTSTAPIPRNIAAASTTARAKRKSPKKRKTRCRRTRVLEYEVTTNGEKFPIRKVKRVAIKKRRRKRRVGKKRIAHTATSTAASSFRFSNSNVYELQKGRQLAGLNNFNIFEPANQLDYVPEDDIEETIENISEQASPSGDVLTQGIINYINPHRRKALIKKRVIDNFTTTSSSCDLIDSILNDTGIFKPGGNSRGSKVKKASDGNANENNNPSNSNKSSETNTDASTPSSSNLGTTTMETTGNTTETSQNNSGRSEDQQNETILTPAQGTCNDKKSPQKKKKPAFDMFASPNQEEEEEEQQGGCPNFSIYDSVTDNEPENTIASAQVEENFDLVQMSDEGEPTHQQDLISEDIEPALIVKSQPASPDLENDGGEQTTAEERSYTPPLIVPKVTQEVTDDENKRSKKNKDKKSKRQEVERYKVRDRLREKSPLKTKDQFGRNRTRSRSKSREKRRKKSRSQSKSRRYRSKSRSYEKRQQRQRQKSKSLSRKRDSSEDRKRKKNKRKKADRRSISRSLSPRYSYGHRNEEKSRKKRDRTPSPPSEKAKKKKHRSKERTSTLTKEVYTSGQNIMVSVNFSNTQQQDDKRSTKSTSRDDNEPIVDITAKKKINVSSKPVAIIDLARSPFKELTPEYKKESNVIELSDSEGEKHAHLPKSPDSTKLYDPFDILNSPPNENVSSSQQKAIPLKAIEHRDMAIKGNLQPPIIQKNLPLSNEENLVTSSSSVNAFEKNFPARSSKVEVLQHEIIQNLNMDMTASIESPYSPGNDDTYHEDDDESGMQTSFKPKTASAIGGAGGGGVKSATEKPINLFDELFGSSSPPGLDRIKSGSKKSSADPTNKYINKLKRQERVIEEVKGAIKPYYSKRAITKEQYKEIMRKAVPKICHNKSGEINPSKIKHLIESYVKFYSHRKKQKGLDETI